MSLPHLCIDIDGTLTHDFIEGRHELIPEQIKGGGRFGEQIARAVDHGFPLTIATYKTSIILTREILKVAQIPEGTIEKLVIAAFFPKRPELVGKNLHKQYGAEQHGLINNHEQLHILFDDCAQNCQLFHQHRNSRSLLVNGDEAHIDAFQAIVDTPENAISIIEEASRLARHKRDSSSFFLR